MKSWFINQVIKFILLLLGSYFNAKVFFYNIIFGAEGIGHVLQRIPQVFIPPIIKKYGGVIGVNCRILPGITFHNLSGKMPFRNLKIGNNVYIGRNVLIDLADKVVLDDDTALGAGCQVWTHVGDYTYDFTDYHEKKGPVLLEKGVLVWSGVIISPETTIGEFTRVGAGSVVTKNLKPKVFYAGIPAKFISERKI